MSFRSTLVRPVTYPIEQPFQVQFPNRSVAEAVKIRHDSDLKVVLSHIGLTHTRPVLVVVGGASQLSQADFERVRSLFTTVLAPLAERVGAYVVDGGTDAGVMQMMGMARAEVGASFPLVGVLPYGVAIFPGQPAPQEIAAALEPNHTHFVLTPGSAWGDESPCLAHIASVLAGENPSVSVLINGGEITWIDAAESVEEGRAIIVIAGSGRAADIIADALEGNSTEQRAKRLVSSGLLQAVDLECSEQLESILHGILA